MRVLEARLLERELDRQAEEQSRIKGEHVERRLGQPDPQLRAAPVQDGEGPSHGLRDERPRRRARRRPGPVHGGVSEDDDGRRRALKRLWRRWRCAGPACRLGAGRRLRLPRQSGDRRRFRRRRRTTSRTASTSRSPSTATSDAASQGHASATRSRRRAPTSTRSRSAPAARPSTCTFNLKSGTKLFLVPGANVIYYWQIDGRGRQHD